MIVNAEKTSNKYLMATNQYKELIRNKINKEYKRVIGGPKEKSLNHAAKALAESLKYMIA